MGPIQIGKGCHSKLPIASGTPTRVSLHKRSLLLRDQVGRFPSCIFWCVRGSAALSRRQWSPQCKGLPSDVPPLHKKWPGQCEFSTVPREQVVGDAREWL